MPQGSAPIRAHPVLTTLPEGSAAIGLTPDFSGGPEDSGIDSALIDRLRRPGGSGDPVP
ncbi:hypothetical protein [Arthrobacter crusticola]|uniref:hypothetical protein n=1 Tax=Arthrobacter crusticola TaxID=2547960 RepID=UPI001404F9B9|nr:hypothetical protein [Arthrobacter crusticola]